MSNEIKEKLDIFDEKGDGKIDGTMIGTVVRACGLKPNMEQLNKAVGKEYKKGEARVGADEVAKVYEKLSKDCKTSGTVNDFIEVLKVFDKESTGKIPAGELRHTLASLGESLETWETEDATRGLEDADGNIKIKEFCQRIMNPPGAKV